MRSILFSFICALVALASALPGSAHAADRPVVAVTIAPQAWAVQAVAGPHVEVLTLVPPEADPHTYEPKPSQLAKLTGAELYLTIGLEFERAWLPRLSAANPDLTVAAMDAGIHKLDMSAHGHGHADEGHHDEHHGEEHGHHDLGGGIRDPHVWTAPQNMIRMSENARDALSAMAPRLATEFATAQLRLADHVARLDRELAALLAPVRGRSFLVFHPSWGYFAEAYGLRQVPIEAGGREPSPRELAETIEHGREIGADAIVVQPQTSTKSAQVVADALGARLVMADPLAGDWETNLRHVAEALKEAAK